MVTFALLLFREPGKAVPRRTSERRGDDTLWLLAGLGCPSRLPAERRASAGEADLSGMRSGWHVWDPHTRGAPLTSPVFVVEKEFLKIGSRGHEKEWDGREGGVLEAGSILV